MTASNPKADALRAMREANYAAATADVPKSILRKPVADLRAAAKAAAERASRARELKVPLRDPKPKVRPPRTDEERAAAKVKRANREARESGEAAKMPLVGREAEAAIAAVRKQKPDAGDQRSTTMAKKRKTKKAAKTKAKVPRSKAAANTASGRKNNRYDWGGAEEKAAAGHVPAPMDFTAECHAPYRDRKTELENLAKEGNVAQLKALEFPTYNSTSRALGRWRDLALTALTKKAA